MKVRVDEDKCIGCGTCESISETNFKLKEQDTGEMKAEVIKQPNSSEEDLCKQAAESCPTDAIIIE